METIFKRWQQKTKYVAIANKCFNMSCPHVKFLCFATFFLKFFVAEAKKNIQTDLIFFLFQQQKTCVASTKT